MNHTLIQNFFIAVLVLVVAYMTGDPLTLLGLFFMHDLPVHVLTNEQQIRAHAAEKQDDEEDDPAIGFTAPIK